jgi:hypothetical protein
MSTDDNGRRRFDRAIEEVEGIAASQPPDPADPIVIVYFTDQADEPRTFTDLPSLKGFLAGLHAQGGTSIANGLRRALSVLENNPGAREFLLFLITDGEDSDLAGIESVQTEINKRLKARQQRQLSNTVFVRAWSPAVEQSLATPIAKDAAVQIQHATTRLVPVQVVAMAQVGSVAWSKAGRSVRATGRCKAEAKGNSTPVTADVSLIPDRGQDRIMLKPDGNEVPFDVELPIAVDEVMAARPVAVELAVGVTRYQPFEVDGAYELTPNPSRVRVEFALPPLRMELAMSATPAAGRWVSLADDRAEFEIDLAWEVRGAPVFQPMEFRLGMTGAGASLVRGDRFQVASERGSTRCALSLTIPSGAKRRVTFQPDIVGTSGPTVTVVPFEFELTGPPPVTLQAGAASGAHRQVLEGYVEAQTRTLARRLRLEPPEGSSPDLLRSLKLEPVVTVAGRPSRASPITLGPDRELTVDLDLPGSAPLWQTERIDAEVTFRCPPTSVAPAPLKLVVFREPLSALLLTVLMAAAAVSGLGVALWKVARTGPSRSTTSRMSGAWTGTDR